MLSRLRQVFPLRAEGCWWTPLPGDEIYERLRSGKRFEGQELDFVAGFARHIKTFWDIGANFGLFSVVAGKAMGPMGHVLSVEPDPRNAQRLRKNLRLNRLRGASVVEAAVGGAECSVTFSSCDQGAYSSLRTSEVPGKVRSIEVRQTTLDNLAAAQGWPQVELIKIDVEGAELDVLHGGRTFFGDRTRPIVMAEFSDRRTGAYGHDSVQAYDSLAAMRYRWFRLNHAGGLEPEARQSTYDYSNLIACPEEKVGILANWTGDNAHSESIPT